MTSIEESPFGDDVEGHTIRYWPQVRLDITDDPQPRWQVLCTGYMEVFSLDFFNPGWTHSGDLEGESLEYDNEIEANAAYAEKVATWRDILIDRS